MSKSKQVLRKMNESGKRTVEDHRQTVNASQVPGIDRRKTNRRRQIDPTTCEREYSDMEVEFMQAMDEYKRLSGRMFPTCSEILEVLTNLGYRQVAESQKIYQPAEAKK